MSESPRNETPNAVYLTQRSLIRTASVTVEPDFLTAIAPVLLPSTAWQHSRAVSLFEVLLILALLFTFVVTPIELAFFWIPSHWSVSTPLAARLGWLYVSNRLVDAVFLVDVVRQASTAYFDHRTNTMCTDRRRIFRRYAGNGGLLLDLIAVFPLDLLEQPVRNTLAVVVLRVLRLFKLRRAATLSLPLMVQDRLRLKSGHVNLMSYFAMTIALSHFMACGFVLVAAFQTRHAFSCNWVSFYYNYLQSRGGECEPPMQPPTLSSLYLAAMVWSMETIATVGYGDVVPTTDAEHAYVFLAMLSGGGFFSYVVGNFVAVMQSLQQQQRVAESRLDTLNALATSVDMDDDLAARLRSYLRSQDKEIGRDAQSMHSLLSLFPPAIRVDIAKSTGTRMFSKLPMLQAALLQLLIELSIAFKPIYFPSGEELCHVGMDARRGLVLLLRRGLVRTVDFARDRHLHPHGSFFSAVSTPAAAEELIIGEEALWSLAFPERGRMELLCATVTAVTSVDCLGLPAADLVLLLGLFPEFVAELRAPVRARYLRRSLRTLRAGVRRVRALGDPAKVSFTRLLAAARDDADMWSSVCRASVRLSRQLSTTVVEANEPPSQQLNKQMACFVVQCAAETRFFELTAGAVRIQAVFRGKKARELARQLRARQVQAAEVNLRLEAALAGGARAPSQHKLSGLIASVVANVLEKQSKMQGEWGRRRA